MSKRSAAPFVLTMAARGISWTSDRGGRDEPGGKGKNQKTRPGVVTVRQRGAHRFRRREGRAQGYRRGGLSGRSAVRPLHPDPEKERRPAPIGSPASVRDGESVRRSVPQDPAPELVPRVASQGAVPDFKVFTVNRR